MSYFSLFSLPRHLELDLAALEKEFYTQSRRLHPDRFASRPAAEQAEALARSSALNDAYRTLRDPIARTEYLLALEEEAAEPARVPAGTRGSEGGENKQKAPPDLLEEAFELNMQLEEMRMAKLAGEKDEQTEKDLENARTRFTAMLNGLGADLEGLWKRWDRAEDAGDAGQKAAVRDAMAALLNRRSYVRNLVRDVNAVLE